MDSRSLPPTLTQDRGEMFGCKIVSAFEQPRLNRTTQNANHPLNKSWPMFLDHDEAFRKYVPLLSEFEDLARLQLMVVRDGVVVALARSVAIFWSVLDHEAMTKSTSPRKRAYGDDFKPDLTLAHLPDNGYDGILSSAVEQYIYRASGTSVPKPNLLASISITVVPEWRGRKLPDYLISTLKRIAVESEFHGLIVPLRPTLKSQFPFVPLETYILWPKDPLLDSDSRKGVREQLPFDPWLRTHKRLGAAIIGICPRSMVIRGTRSEWEVWTGLDLADEIRRAETEVSSRGSDVFGRYVEIAIPHGLVPLRVYVEIDLCSYTEPNVWLAHPVRTLPAHLVRE